MENEWVRVAVNTYSLDIPGGKLYRYTRHGHPTLVFVPSQDDTSLDEVLNDVN